MNPKVECGFRKWSIGYDKEMGCINVEFSYHPHYGKIDLHDVSLDELEKLGDMFTGLAKLYKSQLVEK